MKCNYCEFRCDLEGEKFGVCRMYRESDGKITERFPNMWVSGVSRIESLPLYHIYPGTRSFVIGTASCNFRCKYCSNSFIAREKPENVLDRLDAMPPEKLIAAAKKNSCDNIVFNVNEPTVSLQSLEGLAAAAKDAGMPLGCLTNAYFTEEAGELMTSVFSFFNVGFKGLSDEFNRRCLGIPSVKPIIRNLQMLGKKSHVEVITPVIPGMNDMELEEMADIIADIDRDIPWHAFRLLPESDMKGEKYPSIEDINEKLNPCRKKLRYVYFHNFVGSDWVNTKCPECGAVVIERFSMGCGGDMLKKILCRDGRCQECGAAVRLIEKK